MPLCWNNAQVLKFAIFMFVREERGCQHLQVFPTSTWWLPDTSLATLVVHHMANRHGKHACAVCTEVHELVHWVGLTNCVRAILSDGAIQKPLTGMNRRNVTVSHQSRFVLSWIMQAGPPFCEKRPLWIRRTGPFTIQLSYRYTYVYVYEYRI
jgi:hypothetical protein